MPIPRMTTRRWMIAVALVSIVLAGIHTVRIERQFRSHTQRAEAFAQVERVARASESKLMKDAVQCRDEALVASRRAFYVAPLGIELEGAFDPMPGSGLDIPTVDDGSLSEMLATQLSEQAWSLAKRAVDLRQQAMAAGRKAQHAAQMKVKYRQAARCPRLPVSPDPPME